MARTEGGLAAAGGAKQRSGGGCVGYSSLLNVGPQGGCRGTREDAQAQRHAAWMFRQEQKLRSYLASKTDKPEYQPKNGAQEIRATKTKSPFRPSSKDAKQKK